MKRLLSLLTAAALVLTLVPSGALATEGTQEPAACTCTTKCAEGAGNQDCPVCGAEGADLTACKGPESQQEQSQQNENPPAEPEEPVCTCTTKCAEGAANEDCPVCGAVGADLTACKGPESQQGQPQQNENPPAEPEEPVCTCTAKCAEDATNGECPVCGADLTLCAGQESTENEADEAVVAVQAALDILPTAEALAAMSQEEQQTVYTALQSAYDAYCILTDEQKVQISGAEKFDALFAVFNTMITTLESTGSFTVSGGTYGQDYSYADGILTILTGTPLTLSCTHTTTDRIVVGSGVSANLTLAGLSIDLSSGTYVNKGDLCPLSMEGAGASTITLAEGSVNTLKAGEESAGILIPEGRKITINGTGVLDVAGGLYWPGIGRNGDGVLEIQSGIINVSGGSNAASIGGSWNHSGGEIIISGGFITATGKIGGSGLGSVNSFSTGNGNPIIYCSYIGGRFNIASLNGIIVEGSKCGIYGSQTIGEDFFLPENPSLFIAANGSLTLNRAETFTSLTLEGSGSSLTIGDGYSATVTGETSNYGTVAGSLTCTGTVYNSGSLPEGAATGTLYTAPYLKVENGNYSLDGALEAGKQVTVHSAPQDGYMLSYWEVQRGNLTLTSDQNSADTFTFLMPQDCVFIKANYREIVCSLTVNGSTTYFTDAWLAMDKWCDQGGTLTVLSEDAILDTLRRYPDGGILDLNGFSVNLMDLRLSDGNLIVQNGTICADFRTEISPEASLTIRGDVTLKPRDEWMNLEVTNQGTIVVEPGASLNLPDGVVLTNNGILTNAGTIQNSGTITNTGTVTNSGTINNSGTITGTIDGNAPISVLTEIPYMEDGQEKTCETAIRVETATTAWNGGWYVVSDSVTIDQRVTVTGDVKLILTDGCQLTVNGGIQVSEGSTLTIYAQSGGTGILEAISSDGAGIGGSSGNGAGTIIINGGTVNATGGGSGAGIGGGESHAGGTIIINGGTVNATGGPDGGAGIGGAGCTLSGNCGNVIQASSVTADTSGFAGVIQTGTEYRVYGDAVLTEDLTIHQGETLTIPGGGSLDCNGKLTNDGTVVVESGGKLEGTSTGSGTLKVAPTITTVSLPQGTLGTAYSQTLEATGDTPITWSSSDLPGWLTLDENTGKISGTPTAAGDYQFTVTAANDSGSGSKELSITVCTPPSITTGANGTWDSSSTDGLTITSDADFSLFMEVQVDGKVLTKDKDYIIREGSTIVTLKPDYLRTLSVGPHTIRIVSQNGTAETNFTILGDIAGAKITLGTALTYTGKDQTQTIASVTLNGKTLVAGTDYTVTNNTGKNAGTYTLTITGKGNYTGTLKVSFPIAKAPLTITGVDVQNKAYDGTTAATVTGVTFGGLVNKENLALGIDYTATADFENAAAGKGKAVSAKVTLLSSTVGKNYTLNGGSFTTSGDISAAASKLSFKVDRTKPVKGQYITFSVTPQIKGDNRSFLQRVLGINAPKVEFWANGTTKLGEVKVEEGKTSTFAYDTDKGGLKLGKNTITAEFTGDGNLKGCTESVVVYLHDSTTSAPTGDESNIQTWTAVLVVSAVVLIGLGVGAVIYRKKKK